MFRMHHRRAREDLAGYKPLYERARVMGIDDVYVAALHERPEEKEGRELRPYPVAVYNVERVSELHVFLLVCAREKDGQRRAEYIRVEAPYYIEHQLLGAARIEVGQHEKYLYLLPHAASAALSAARPFTTAIFLSEA